MSVSFIAELSPVYCCLVLVIFQSNLEFQPDKVYVWLSFGHLSGRMAMPINFSYSALPKNPDPIENGGKGRHSMAWRILHRENIREERGALEMY